jgi:uncharacterized membrane protein
MMILGYQRAPFVNVWFPPAWGIHLNNLLMLLSVAFFGMGKSRGRARSWLRHPMLTGVVVWAVAHLRVNGDLATVLRLRPEQMPSHRQPCRGSIWSQSSGWLDQH